MHRDVVSHVAVAKQSDFIITGSVDGHVKFWKKMLVNIEFVKHFQVNIHRIFEFVVLISAFQAHLGPINALVVSPDGKMLVTTSTDK